MSNKIYCFSLTAARKEGTVVTVSSQPFIVYHETEVLAQEMADSYIKKVAYPINQGWYDHQVPIPIIIAKSKVLQIANEYKNENYDAE